MLSSSLEAFLKIWASRSAVSILAKNMLKTGKIPPFITETIVPNTKVPTF